MAVDNVGWDVPVNFGDSRSNGFRDIREADFVSNERADMIEANPNSALGAITVKRQAVQAITVRPKKITNTQPTQHTILVVPMRPTKSNADKSLLSACTTYVLI